MGGGKTGKPENWKTGNPHEAPKKANNTKPENLFSTPHCTQILNQKALTEVPQSPTETEPQNTASRLHCTQILNQKTLT